MDIKKRTQAVCFIYPVFSSVSNMTNKSIVYHRTNFFSADYFFQISCCIHIEYYNREIIFLAHASSCKVHHLQTTFQHFIISDIIEFCSSRIFFNITSASISMPRREEPVSVVKNGLPVPADMITISPASIYSIAFHLL